MQQNNLNDLAEQKRKAVNTAEFTEDGRYKRKVRSFVLRTGRLSEAQKRAMNDNWAEFGLEHQADHLILKRFLTTISR